MNSFNVRIGRRGMMLSAMVLFAATLVCAAPTLQAKELRLKNTASGAVEYGLSTAGAPPNTTIAIRVGETRRLFVQPIREYLWFRYNNTSAWHPFMIPDASDSVYKWKFVSSGAQPGVDGAPEIP